MDDKVMGGLPARLTPSPTCAEPPDCVSIPCLCCNARMLVQAMYCVLASSDGCSIVAAGQDGCAHMWRLEAQTLAMADSYRLPQAK